MLQIRIYMPGSGNTVTSFTCPDNVNSVYTFTIPGGGMYNIAVDQLPANAPSYVQTQTYESQRTLQALESIAQSQASMANSVLIGAQQDRDRIAYLEAKCELLEEALKVQYHGQNDSSLPSGAQEVPGSMT